MPAQRQRSTYVVSANTSKYEVLPASAKAILGEYVEAGSNHGRKYFRRVAATKNLPDVLLFYWDARDGQALSGWWFGNKIGGGQVWGRSSSHGGSAPPLKGWKCPVDGAVVSPITCRPQRVHADDGEEEEVVMEEENPVAAGPKPPTKRPPPELLKAAGQGPAKRPALVKPQVLLFMAPPGKDLIPAAQKKLLGEYVVNEQYNHGKKVFVKEDPDGRSGGPVWLYYWDKRDGVDHSGWWLGESLGGENVFARAFDHGIMPPMKGWRVPAEEEVAKDLMFVVKGREEEIDMPDAVRLDTATNLVNKVTKEAEKAVQTSQSMLVGPDDGEVFEEGVRAVFELLRAKVDAIDEAKGSMQRHLRAAKKHKASEEVQAEFALLEERLQAVTETAEKALDTAEAKLVKVESAEQEERDARTIEEALPLAIEEITQAEMAADAAKDDDAAFKAREMIEEASTTVRKMLQAAKKFAPDAQKTAVTEFTALSERCEEAERKLSNFVGGGPTLAATRELDDAEAPGEAAAPAAQIPEGPIGFEAGLGEAEVLGLFTEMLEDVESKAKNVLETAKELLGGSADDKTIEAHFSKLESILALCEQAFNALEREYRIALRRKVAPATRASMQALRPRLQAVRRSLAAELSRGQQRLQDTQRRELEAQELAAVESALPIALSAVSEAEAAVEAVSAGVEADELRSRVSAACAVGATAELDLELKKLMDDLHVVIERAQGVILDARPKVDAQMKAAKALTGEELQKAAVAEVTPLRKRLIDAQKTLNVFKVVSKEYDRHNSAKEEMEGLSRKVEALEGSVQKLSAKLAVQMGTETEVKAAEASIKETQDEMVATLQSLEQKARDADKGSDGGSIREYLVEPQLRLREARRQVETMKEQIVDQRQGLAAKELVRRADQDVEKAQAWLSRLQEAEAPWKTSEASGKLLAEEVAKEALEACESLASQAEPAIRMHKTFIGERLSEIRRLPDCMLRLQASEELQTLQAKVDKVSLKVKQFKVETFARRTRLQITDVVQQVLKAEVAAKSVQDAAADFELDLEKAQGKKLEAAKTKTLKAAEKAAPVCEEARKVVDARKQDPKVRISPSLGTELKKMSDRLAAAEEHVTGLKEAAQSAKSNQKALEAQKRELKRLDGIVSDMELQTLPMGDEQPTEEEEENTANSIQGVQDTVAAWLRELEAVQRNPHIGYRVASARTLAEARKLQARIVEARSIIREQLERASCRLFAREAAKKIADVEGTMKKAEAAEAPFLKGVEISDSAQHSKAVTACETAATAAQKALDEAQEFFKARCSEVSGFACEDAASKQHISKLRELSRKADAASEKLGQYRSELLARKRSAGSAQDAPARKVAKTA